MLMRFDIYQIMLFIISIYKKEKKLICFARDRSRVDLGEQEATSGVSKVTMSFLIWLQWRRASVMDSQWELL